jgi:histidinol-phosphate phosphatase family protein
MAYKAAFLDRDGTINGNVPYCSHPDQFKLLPGAAEGIRLLNESGFKVIIVTNQSGIARGYFTEEMLGYIHGRMCRLLAGYGAHVDAIYYCPHHPDDRCQCRKPQLYMVFQAMSDIDIDMTESYTVGDTDADVEMGRRAGCRAVIKIGESEGYPANQVVPSLLDAAKWIVGQRPLRS